MVLQGDMINYPPAFGYKQQQQPQQPYGEEEEYHYYSHNDSTSAQLVRPRPRPRPRPRHFSAGGDETSHKHFISAPEMPQYHMTGAVSGGGGYPVPQHHGGGHWELNPSDDACGEKYASSGNHHYYGGKKECHGEDDYDDNGRHRFGGNPYYSMRKLPFAPFMSGGSGGGYGRDETAVDGFSRPAAAAWMEGQMRRPKFDFSEKKVDRWELKSID